MWMEQIVVALITAGLGLVGVMITNYFSNKSLGDKVQHQLEVSQAVTETKIEELTREVRPLHLQAIRCFSILNGAIKRPMMGVLTA